MLLRGMNGMIRKMRPLYIQVLFTLIAFLATAVLSYFFMRGIVHGYLLQNVDSVLSFTQIQFEAELRGSQINLNGFARTVRNMVLRGDDAGKLQNYFSDISSYVYPNMQGAPSLYRMFGYFDTLPGGPVFIGDFDWVPPAGFIPTERPWYVNAVEAGGDMAETLSYKDVVSGGAVLTYSLCIFDDKGRRLGVIGQRVDIGEVGTTIVDTALARGGYGILLSKDLIVLAHPNNDFVGRHVNDPEIPFSIFTDELQRGAEIFERPLTSFKNEAAVAFFRKLPNGWRLGIVTPKDRYYRDVTNMAFIIGGLGMFFAASLIFVLIRVDAAKSRSDMESMHKSAFLANMSHEVRTPINAILGITEILLEKDEFSPDTMEALSKIYNSGDLLLGIINDLLDLSKIEAGKMELMPARYDIASLINDTVHLNKIKYESKPIDFRLSVEEKTPSVMIGDELRIKQILNNLLSNAFKYTQSGEVELSVDAETGDKPVNRLETNKADAGDITLVIRVRDTGCGMTEEQIEKLFDKYERFNIEANRTTEGTGLGMNITWNLIRMMDGDISVKSKPGKGSVFTVRLRQESVGADALGKEMADNLQRFRLSHALQIKRTKLIREPMPYGSVLIVDDTETNLYVTKGLLVHYGLKIDTASSGMAAIEKIKNGRTYDIVFMDHMMPVMDGMEATKILRDMGYTRTIVALTANAVMGQADVFLANGFDGFISKPIDMRHLNATLNKLIRDKQPPEVIEAARKTKIVDKAAANASHRMDSQMAESFIRDATKVITELGAIFENGTITGDGNLDIFTISVHGIKSALAGIGEAACSSLAFRLEQAGRQHDISVITTETPAFLDELKAVVNRLKSTYSTEAASFAATREDAGDDPRYIREKLLDIKAACGAYDIKAAEDALAELKTKTRFRQTRELLDNIAVYLLHSEFDEAADLIDDYLKH